jgi:acetolactate synthase-1/2/3 large subunit
MPSGGDAICTALERCGVQHVFGLPGTQNIGLFDGLRRSRIRTILATHELAAAFMANGYYRSSGRVGVLVTIGGPGLAYTVAGIAEAAQDSSALLHITVLPPNNPRRKFDFQAIDQHAIMAPLVKRIIDVTHGREVAAAISEGFRETTRGEPGPVLVQVDHDVLSAEVDTSGTDRVEPQLAAEKLEQEKLQEIVTLLQASRRALVFAGQGAHGAAQQLLRLAELLGAPVVTTRSGRGIVPEDHALSFVFDVSDAGAKGINALLDRSDLILAIGCKLSHNGTYGFRLRLQKEKLIHCDAAESVLNANYAARVVCCADSRVLLAALLDSQNSFKTRVASWNADELASFRRLADEAKTTAEPAIHGVKPRTPAAFFAALRAALPGNTCLVTDSGLHQVLAVRHFRVDHPRGLLIPSDFQSMGFGLPAGIGAKLANPERVVTVLIGDGGLAMSGMELLTIVREQIPLIVIVFNDGALGQIRLQQHSTFGFDHATSLVTPDLGVLAHSMGLAYRSIDNDVDVVLAEALRSNAPMLLEVKVGDSNAVRRERAKGIVRGVARRLMKPTLRNRIKAWLGLCL